MDSNIVSQNAWGAGTSLLVEDSWRSMSRSPRNLVGPCHPGHGDQARATGCCSWHDRLLADAGQHSGVAGAGDLRVVEGGVEGQLPGNWQIWRSQRRLWPWWRHPTPPYYTHLALLEYTRNTRLFYLHYIKSCWLVRLLP